MSTFLRTVQRVGRATRLHLRNKMELNRHAPGLTDPLNNNDTRFCLRDNVVLTRYKLILTLSDYPN
jgi:hypothetical protein